MANLHRLQSLIRDTVSQILNKSVNNPKIGFISITGVKVSTDGAHAWVYYSQIGSDEEKKQTRYALKSASKFIKGEFGKVTKIKIIPNFHFVYDDSLERGSDIIEKLNELSDEDSKKSSKALSDISF